MAGFFMRGRMAGMKRSLIEDLLLGTVLVAVGIATMCWAIHVRSDSHFVLLLSAASFFGGPVAIGTGLLAPLHKKEQGAVIGAVIGFPLFALMLLVTSGTI
jgi:hypothetical protein